MVTRRELQGIRKQLENEKKEAKIKSEKFWENEHKEREKRQLVRVRAIIDTEISDLLALAAKNGYEKIEIEEYKVYHNGSEFYEANFKLDFAPDPKYKPTKELIKLLKQRGFKVSVRTKMIQNVEYFTTADGYDTRDVPGEHAEYSLIVEWVD